MYKEIIILYFNTKKISKKFLKIKIDKKIRFPFLVIKAFRIIILIKVVISVLYFIGFFA